MKKFIVKVAEKYGYTELADKENIYDMCFSLFYGAVFVFVCYIFIFSLYLLRCQDGLIDQYTTTVFTSNDFFHHAYFYL